MMRISELCLFDVGFDGHIRMNFDDANINVITLYVNTFIKINLLEGDNFWSGDVKISKSKR
jgi:hypothetical protein